MYRVMLEANAEVSQHNVAALLVAIVNRILRAVSSDATNSIQFPRSLWVHSEQNCFPPRRSVNGFHERGHGSQARNDRQ